MQEKPQFCPNCQGKLIILKADQTVCRYCGEKVDNNDTEEKSKNRNSEIINSFSPSFCMWLGYCTMLFTLLFYNTTVCNSSSGCTSDMGLINNKSNLITAGGFLFLGGCVLSKNQDEKSKK